MKKWITGIVFQLACLPAAFGMYSGNPADPMLGNGSLYFCDSPWWSAKLGYQRDYVTDRKLKSEKFAETHRVDDFHMVSDQGTIAFDFCKTFEVYGSVGAGRVFMRTRPGVVGLPQVNEKWETVDGTMWSVGGKVVLWDCDNAIISVLGGYEQLHAKFAWDDLHFTNPRGTRAKLRYNEWQVSVGSAYNFCCAVPYINLNFSGLTASKVKNIREIPPSVTLQTIDNTFKLKARKLVGLSIGTSWVPVDCFYVTVEARLINERSMTFQAQVKF
jgi:hypothetical protein